eukprot:scaffold17233_cov87-Cylindrotheca_fusiformis.AAC.2
MLQVVRGQVLRKPVPVNLGALRDIPAVGAAEALELRFVVGVREMRTAVQSNGPRDRIGDRGLCQC